MKETCNSYDKCVWKSMDVHTYRISQIKILKIIDFYQYPSIEEGNIPQASLPFCMIFSKDIQYVLSNVQNLFLHTSHTLHV